MNKNNFESAFLEKKLGHSNLQLKNVFIKSAAYEGMYENGIPNKKLIDHHVALARGEVALTTISYGAVSASGRTFGRQMYINDQSIEKLRLLVQEVHKAGGKISIQLTHCGYFTKNKDVKYPPAPSRLFNKYGFMSGIMFSKAMTKAEMGKVSDDFSEAALRCKSAGFDAIEIHMGHGYLLSQFLSPRTNKRKDEYGGSVENRARYPLEVLKKVIHKVGREFPVLVKLNLSDGFRGGFTIDDCRYVSKELEKYGCTAIILSGGFTSKTPFYLMRGDVPLRGMIMNGTHIAERMTMALFGPFVVKRYKFAPNFFLAQAKVIREAVRLPLVYLGGVDSRKGIEEILHAGFEFIAIARAFIHDADFLIKLRKNQIEKTECNRCNKCIVEMDRGGVKCVI